MIDILRERRSIRKYTTQVIESEKIELLKEAALRSPTSRNNKPCEFIFINDKNTISSLSESKQHGSAFLKNAPLAVIVCADETKSDVWVEDCSIASILLQLTAQSQSLGSCWIQIRKRLHSNGQSSEDYIKTLLNLAANIRVEAIISIGYPAETREPIAHDELDFKKILKRG